MRLSSEDEDENDDEDERDGLMAFQPLLITPIFSIAAFCAPLYSAPTSAAL